MGLIMVDAYLPGAAVLLGIGVPPFLQCLHGELASNISIPDSHASLPIVQSLNLRDTSIPTSCCASRKQDTALVQQTEGQRFL